MDRDTGYFVALVVLLLVLAGGGYYYHSESMNAMAQDHATSIAQLQSQLNQQGDLLADLNAVLLEQGSELRGKIAYVQERQEEGLAEVTRNVQESAGKLAELEEDIGNIDIETKGFTQVIEDTVGSVVSLRTNNGVGSGVVIDYDGYVLTNYHVIEDISALAIVFADGKQYAGRIAGFDERADLAVLKISSNKKFEPLDFGSVEDLKVGQKVIAIGNPSGLDFTVTEGIVSALDRRNRLGYQMVQSSVPINPGNSGGPLIDGNGNIVGINTYKVTGTEGLGFAMNPDTASEISLLITRSDRQKIEDLENAAE